MRLHHQFLERDDVLEHILLRLFQSIDPRGVGKVSHEHCRALLMDKFPLIYTPAHEPECRAILHRVLGQSEDIDYHELICFLRPRSRTVRWTLQKSMDSIGRFEVEDIRFFDGRQGILKTLTFAENQLPENEVTVLTTIENLKCLAHANLIRYVGSMWQSTSQLLILQEHHEVCTLDTLMRAFGKMKEPMLRRYCCQMVDAIVYLHAQDVVHGNLSGQSIYVDHAGHVALGEYGLPQDLLLHGSRPEEGAFAAPENHALRKAKMGKKADCWAVGIMALEMIYGDELSRASSLKELLTPGSTLGTCFSRSCLEFIELCLEPEPHRRPDSTTLFNHAFLHEHENTIHLLSDVCSGLDATMARLHEAIPETLVVKSKEKLRYRRK